MLTPEMQQAEIEAEQEAQADALPIQAGTRMPKVSDPVHFTSDDGFCYHGHVILVFENDKWSPMVEIAMPPQPGIAFPCMVAHICLGRTKYDRTAEKNTKRRWHYANECQGAKQVNEAAYEKAGIAVRAENPAAAGRVKLH